MPLFLEVGERKECQREIGVREAIRGEWLTVKEKVTHIKVAKNVSKRVLKHPELHHYFQIFSFFRNVAIVEFHRVDIFR